MRVLVHEGLQPRKGRVDLVVGDVVDVDARADAGRQWRAEQPVPVHDDLVARALVGVRGDALDGARQAEPRVGVEQLGGLMCQGGGR